MTDRPVIAVVDYGAGNMVSIEQALTTVGGDVRIVEDASGLRDAKAVVVPGVGAAAPAMARLERQDLVAPIKAWIAEDRQFLGICLGLQLLFEGSDEDGTVTLGVLPGRTRRLRDAPTLPHIGWNQVDRTYPHPVFEGIDKAADFYFVHSYAGDLPSEHCDVVAQTTHGATFVSAVSRGNLLGVQFHPERSGPDGLRFLANFVDLVRAA